MLHRKVKRKADPASCKSRDGPKEDKLLKTGKKHSKNNNADYKSDSIQSTAAKLRSKSDHSDSKSDKISTLNVKHVKSQYFSKPLRKSEEEDEASVEDLGEASHGCGSKRLSKDFYEQTCEDLAKALLGKILVRVDNGERLAGRIIETESYLGRRDKAAHSYKGKTDRNAAMFMDPGTAYVYNIYGMYCCVNISSQGEGEAVLIRSLEPLEGKSIMAAIRIGQRKKDTGKPMKDCNLCNGPSKLTQSLKIDKTSVNQVDMTSSDLIWLEDADEVPVSRMVVSKRVNIAYAEDWTDKPLRFYEFGNPCVSVRDKEAEKLITGKT